MKFYELPPAVDSAIKNTDIRPYVRVMFELKDNDYFIPNSDILSCNISSYKSTEGGIINVGEITLDNKRNDYTFEMNDGYTTDLPVQIWYCFGDNTNTFLRFRLFVDSNGFQNQATGYLDKTTVIKLVDLSCKLNDEKLQKNWTDDETVIHSVVCDKQNPDKSLVHIIAKRGGIEPSQINCGYLPFSIPYAVIENTAWKELCALARAYNATVECGKDMTLSFIESPYDTENQYSEEVCYELNEKEITHFRYFNYLENYANNIRLKYTRYVETEVQELWKYEDAPCWYDDQMNAYYPFTDDTRKIVSESDYQALYTAKNKDGKFRNVVYASEIDTAEQFLENIQTSENKQFELIKYDTKTYPDRAVIQLGRNDQLIGLYKATINGKAIISETNFSVYVKNETEIKKKGQIVKNVSSKYLSDDPFDEVPFYEKRVRDLLSDSIKKIHGYYLTTYIPMIHARVNACMNIRLNANEKFEKVRIEEITFKYKKDDSFCTCVWVKSV